MLIQFFFVFHAGPSEDLNPPQLFNGQESECIQPSVNDAVEYCDQEKISVSQVREYEHKENEEEIVSPHEGDSIGQCYNNGNENVESFTHNETNIIQNSKDDEQSNEKFVSTGDDHMSYEHDKTAQEDNHSPSTPLQDETWKSPLTLQDVIMRKFRELYVYKCLYV